MCDANLCIMYITQNSQNILYVETKYYFLCWNKVQHYLWTIYLHFLKVKMGYDMSLFLRHLTQFNARKTGCTLHTLQATRVMQYTAIQSAAMTSATPIQFIAWSSCNSLLGLLLRGDLVIDTVVHHAWHNGDNLKLFNRCYN